MSLYMRSPLRSKDLDLLSSQVSLTRMEALAEKLAEIDHVEYRTTTVQTRRFDDRKMVTYAIELRVSGRPFFVELFDKYCCILSNIREETLESSLHLLHWSR